MIEMNCPHCGHLLRINDEYAGQIGGCRNCKGQIKVPYPDIKALHTIASAPDQREIEPNSVQPCGTSAGDTRPCPYCGEQISSIAVKCHYCGEFLNGKQHEVATNIKQGALTGSLVCFLVGIAFMIYLSLFSFFLYLPLFFASFALSIVAMAQKRIKGGITMLLLTTIVPPILFCLILVIHEGYNARAQGNNLLSMQYAQQEYMRQEYMKSIDLYDLHVKYYKTFLNEKTPGVEFKLKNCGNRNLKKIEVTVYFKDANKNTIYEERFLPVNTESFMGQKKPLKPNYIWQIERDKFFEVPNVPDKWQEGNATAKITNIEFEE